METDSTIMPRMHILNSWKLESFCFINYYLYMFSSLEKDF